jgi:membrane associated rhomboid family serine protease
MYALWMFGSEIEREWGRSEFFKYYFLTGIGAGLLTYISSSKSPVPTLGASGAVFGLLAAYGLMYPDRVVLVSFFFPMKAKHFVILYGLMEFAYCLAGTEDGIGHFAHLGGMLIGYVYLKYWPRMALRAGLFYGIGRKLRNLKEKRKKGRDELFSERVDGILDKITRYGIESLNQSEKKILKRYREPK